MVRFPKANRHRIWNCLPGLRRKRPAVLGARLFNDTIWLVQSHLYINLDDPTTWIDGTTFHRGCFPPQKSLIHQLRGRTDRSWRTLQQRFNRYQREYTIVYSKMLMTMGGDCYQGLRSRRGSLFSTCTCTTSYWTRSTWHIQWQQLQIGTTVNKEYKATITLLSTP